MSMTQNRCSFCGSQIERGTGLMYVLANGSIMWFCSSKCFKYYKMKKDPKRIPWTRNYMPRTARKR